MRIRILSPRYGAIFQRDTMNMATIPVKVKCWAGTKLKINAFLLPNNGSVPSEDHERKTSIQLTMGPDGDYKGEITAHRGPWYDLVVEGYRERRLVARRRVTHIGVGDIFLLAGQSNSANSGGHKKKPQSGLVMALGKKKWRVAADPQPLATGKGGSPWAPMGDELANNWHHPIGFVSVGVGGSAVGEWAPEIDQHYPRMQDALRRLKPHGLRAVLWHQGESDSSVGTSKEEYKHTLLKIIKQSRVDWGKSMPWIIARASFVPVETVPQEDFEKIRRAQTEICEEENVYPGPDTDQLLGKKWRHDLLHFGREGLNEHGHLWAQVIMELFP